MLSRNVHAIGLKNKAAQLRELGYDVLTVNASAFKMSDAENASHIVIYRTGYSEVLEQLCHLAKNTISQSIMTLMILLLIPNILIYWLIRKDFQRSISIIMTVV